MQGLSAYRAATNGSREKEIQTVWKGH